MSKYKVADLPDYPVLEKFAGSLWKKNNNFHGAAVMVGAGFSKCASSSGDKGRSMPLWGDLSKKIMADLDMKAASDPLRVSEEYSAYFGRRALNDLIIKEINDKSWVPGDLYKKLLSLPWTEVLTTNWDTLLERSSKDLHRKVYSEVNRQEDLSSSRSPRIVKLHGTVGITEDLTFTEEDYRRYPSKKAAFVNFARQVFIENELCLIGFSGDDPNFLKWAGWVRDQLAGNARRIYLVGALNLSPAKRKYLESINVSPIDLESCVSDINNVNKKHEIACELFLETLWSLKPKREWEWLPKSFSIPGEKYQERTSDQEALVLEGQVDDLRSERESYPGWLVCPQDIARRIDMQPHPSPNKNNIEKMAYIRRCEYLYELAWRKSVSLELSTPWLADQFYSLCDGKSAINNDDKKMVALYLLKCFDLFHEKVRGERLNKLRSIVLGRSDIDVESLNEMTFFDAVQALNKMDYASVERLVDRIDDVDPSWGIKKSFLYAEIGLIDEAGDVLNKSYKKLLAQYRNDKGSVYIFSRLSWARWLMKAAARRKFEDFSDEAMDDEVRFKCDPWQSVRSLSDKIRGIKDSRRNSEALEVSFEPGKYTDGSNRVVFIDEKLHLMDWMCREVGIPIRWGNVNLLVNEAFDLVQLCDGVSLYTLSLSVRAANSDKDKIINNALSRMKVACLDEEEAGALLYSSLSALDYWVAILERHSAGDRNAFSVTKVRVLMEVVARLSVRASPEKAKEIFVKALSFGKREKFRDLWLVDALGSLLKYSFQSIPLNMRGDVFYDALDFPSGSELGLDDRFRWPTIDLSVVPEERNEEASVSARISKIIESVDLEKGKDPDPLVRLIDLISADFLKDNEIAHLRDKLWACGDDLPKIGLLPHAFFFLPFKEGVDKNDYMERIVFGVGKEELMSEQSLISICACAQNKKINKYPSGEQAKTFYDWMVEWRPRSTEDNDFLGLAESEDKRVGCLIGESLSSSIVPSLNKSCLTEKNFAKLRDFYNHVYSPDLLVAFTYFSGVCDDADGIIESVIRRGLMSDSAHTVMGAAQAVLTWSRMGVSASIERLIARVVYILGLPKVEGVHGLLNVAGKLYEERRLAASDTESLAESIVLVYENMSYEKIYDGTKGAVSVSLVREECVKTAKIILDCGYEEGADLQKIIDSSFEDPLPEVRFAIKR